MTSKKGSKLHSIIEKLSEQCVRVSPTDDSIADDEEEEEEIVTVTLQPPVQRKTSRNAKPRRQKRNSKAKKAKTAAKKVSIDKEKKSSGKHETRNFQPVDDDLCIDVNALMSIAPQMQDIDTANVHVAYNSWPLKKGTCKVCFQQLKTRDELLDHVKEFHPDAFKTLPGNPGSVLEDDTVEASVKENEGEGEIRQDEEIFEEEEMEDDDDDDDDDDDSHCETDPDFNVDVDIVSDVSDASESSSDEKMIVPIVNQKRRSARLKALQGSGETISRSNETEEAQSSDHHQDDSDIHIDVAKIINTSPKVADIDLPNSKEFSCKLCEDKYYFQMELDRHIEVRHPESVDDSSSQENPNCEHCGKEFLSKMGLFLHIRKLVRKIEQGERTLEERRQKREQERTCRECGKMFKNLGSLKKHFTSHSDDRPFKCDICDRTFKDKNYVYRHMKTHTGIKSYECKLCKKLFAHSGSLRTHNMLHTGERPFKCQFCDTGFISKFDLKVHENKHTGNMPYKCPHCPKSFPKSNNLKMHLISHSTEKPFPCEVCGKAFKRRDHLRYHLVIHSDDKPYKCDTCNKTFNQHICLRKHLPCRELEKLEKRANKPSKENSPKKQKVARKSPKNKQISDLGNKTSSMTRLAGEHGTEQDINTSARTDVEEDTVSDKQVTDSVAAKNQQKSSKTQTSQSNEQTQGENTDPILSSQFVSSISSAQAQSYVAESHGSASDIAEPVLSNTRQDIDSELVSFMGRSSSSSTVQHCSMDKVDFAHDYRNPSHETSTSSIRTLPHPPRLIEACVYTSSVHQPFVPFNCSSHGAPGMEYEGEGLDLENLPSDGSHGGIHVLGNRSFAQETPNELSSALLAAMDPDNLSSMVENTSAFFPLRHS